MSKAVKLQYHKLGGFTIKANECRLKIITVVIGCVRKGGGAANMGNPTDAL